MKKDYIITFAAELLILTSGVVVYKLAAHSLGKEGFSEYALGMKTAALIQPILLLGLGVGIPRYIAYAQKGKKSDDYFVAGAISIAGAVLVFSVLANLFRDTFAFLLFGGSSYGYLILPICLILVGLSFHALCYSYFRGNIKMLQASLIRLIHGVVPLGVLFYFGNTASSVLTLIGMIWILFSCFALLIILTQLKPQKLTLLPSAKELLGYGVKRLPADIGISAILILPATLTAHIAGVKEAGFVAFCTSVLNMVAALFVPLGLVLLPQMSRMVSQGERHQLNKEIVRILVVSSTVAVSIMVALTLFAKYIIGIYLGKTFLEITDIFRVTVIGIVPFTIYVCMRSVLDAYYVKPINTKNVTVAFGIFLLCSMIPMLVTRDYYHILFSLAAGLFALGGLTLFEIRVILRKTA